jgi:hypothetical protein
MGLLISSAAKCKEKGGCFYRAFDGIDTELARVEKEEIVRQWFICELDDEDPVTPNTLDIANEIRNIRRSFLLTCHFGTLLQPVGTSQSSWRK